MHTQEGELWPCLLASLVDLKVNSMIQAFNQLLHCKYETILALSPQLFFPHRGGGSPGHLFKCLSLSVLPARKRELEHQVMLIACQ